MLPEKKNMKIEKYGLGIFTIADFISSKECDEYIAFSESKDYEIAEIQTQDGPLVMQEIRNNDRVIYDDVQFAEKLFQVAKELLPASIDDWEICGLNERFRFYRYEKNQYFKWHKDGSYARHEKERSFLSFIVYLNDDFVGGATAFRFDKIQPKKGSVLVFPHALLHQGDPVESGVKYVLRTDVMYRQKT